MLVFFNPNKTKQHSVFSWGQLLPKAKGHLKNLQNYEIGKLLTVPNLPKNQNPKVNSDTTMKDFKLDLKDLQNNNNCVWNFRISLVEQSLFFQGEQFSAPVSVKYSATGH